MVRSEAEDEARSAEQSHPLRHAFGPVAKPVDLVYGGPRLHLRDDWPRTPSGPEGSSGSGFKSGAEIMLARAASQKSRERAVPTLNLVE